MGASVSTNSAKVVVNAVSKIASQIVQTSNISQSASQIISVTNVTGDVIISGNRMSQKVNINMSALLDAMSTEQAQQNLATELAQQAKSLTSGLNIGQLSVASNSMDTLVQASIDLVSKIGQTCSSLANQSQQIYVENVVGSVRIENNVQEQITEIIQNCVGHAVANDTAIQDITTRLSQSASATSAGLSEWALVALAALVIGVPVIGGVVGGVVFLKYIFPILLIAGVVAIIVYFYYTSDTMALDAYSKFISNTSACVAEGATPKQLYNTAERASVACLADSNCAGFDWKGIDVNADGTYAILDIPVTTFFSTIQPECQSSVAKDNVKMVRAPVVFSGSGEPATHPPNAVKGDVYVDLVTSQWFQWDRSGSFQPKGIISHDHFAKLVVSGLMPTAAVSGSADYCYVYANPQNPEYWHVYKYVPNAAQRWVEQTKVPGPGMFASAPSITNASGFKTTQRKTWLLYSGIAAIVVGAVGSAYVFLKKDDAAAMSQNKE
jgi:hypothetical protein